MNTEEIKALKNSIREADAIVIGAGAGLSTSAGYVYTGHRFHQYFFDFERKYGFKDMYTGGFYPFETLEEFWGYWCRYIWINRYAPIPKPEVYEALHNLVKDKDYFVLTTNVDHCFQRSGFDKKRLFYTQGDYGLYQSSKPVLNKTMDNEKSIRSMVESEGWRIEEDGTLRFPENANVKMRIPSEIVPKDSFGNPMTTNLRADDLFVEDAGWHAARKRYHSFLDCRRKGKVIFLELGVGYNTPVIIKYPFWQMTKENSNAMYVSINMHKEICPSEISSRSLCMEGDIGEILQEMKNENVV